MTNANTPLQTSISTLIEIDQEEAVLREQLQQLARKKEERKKSEGQKAKDQLWREISETRVKLLALLRTAENLEISLENEYPVTFRRIVKDAGATGISLSLVQEVLPNNEKLQAARDQLGKNGTQEIIELRAKEHLKQGKGRGLFFVWNQNKPLLAEVPIVPQADVADAPAPPIEIPAPTEADDEAAPEDEQEQPESMEPAPVKKAATTKPAAKK